VGDDRVVAVVGDLAQPQLGVSEAEIAELKGKVDHFFHLAAIYDMTADAQSQQVANIEGTRHAVELAEAIEAGCLDTHPYFRTKHESERVVREEYSRPWRVYRPGIVVGDSETGEMDKIDGPYYFFKLIQRLRNTLPQWMPTVGVEGKEINLVPVDFVAKALDHIAHEPGLDGKAFSLTDPAPKSAGQVINLFSRSANAPQMSMRLDPIRSSGTSGSPNRCSPTSTTRPASTAPTRWPRWRAAASPCRRWRPTPTSSGTTGSGTSTPTCSRTARSRARSGARWC
jgi:thioester reductase-like protein